MFTFKKMKEINYFSLLNFLLFSLLLTPSSLKAETAESQYEFQKEIVNLRKFSYLLNPRFDICASESEKKVFLLIYVHTAPENYKRRLVIRETWSQKHLFHNVRIVFFCGLSPQNITNDMLIFENSIYKDIVQKNFLDSYRNLTIKSLFNISI